MAHNPQTAPDFELPDEVVDAGSDGYVRNTSGRPRIESMKAGDSAIFYFVTDPDDGPAQGDWINYREVSAFQGFKGGIETPQGLKEFPVYDQEVVYEDGKPQRRYRRNSDGTPADWLLEQVAPPTRFKTKSGRAEGRDKTIINVVDSEGTHKLVKFSGTIGKMLRKQVRSFSKVNKGFTLLDNPWKVTIVGQGAQQDVNLDPIDEPYPDSIKPTEVINAREVLQQMRADIEKFYSDALAGGTSTFDEEPDEAEDTSYATVSPDDPEPSGMDEFDPWKDVTAVQMRTLIEDAGVEVPPKATKSAMARLALANDIKPSEPAVA